MIQLQKFGWFCCKYVLVYFCHHHKRFVLAFKNNELNVFCNPKFWEKCFSHKCFVSHIQKLLHKKDEESTKLKTKERKNIVRSSSILLRLLEKMLLTKKFRLIQMKTCCRKKQKTRWRINKSENKIARNKKNVRSK